MAFTTESVFNSVNGAMGLFRNINKGGGRTDTDNVENVPEYESSLDENEILETIRDWKARDDSYIREIDVWRKDNERYWLGKQYSPIEQAGTTKRALIDNAIFEAIETYLPIATSVNPDPIVASDPSPEGQALADDIKNFLVYQADRQKLRMILRSMTRHWSLNFLGAIKVYWDPMENDIASESVNTRRLIVDPDATIGAGGIYKGEYLGEYKKLSRSKLIEMFPSKSEKIKDKMKDEGTRGLIIEWWTKTDLFYTLGDDLVLGKFKNPNWNWDGEVAVPDPNDPESTVKQFVKGQNHWKQPEIPYIFLTVFNQGIQPHDDTGLVYQTIPLQDQVNERTRQIEFNVKKQNNGIALNGLFYTKEQSSQALTQLENGGGLWVPNDNNTRGSLDEAFKLVETPSLSGDVFESLNLMHQRLVGIFGTSASTPQGLAQQDDVRGKIMAQQSDSSRIGGGITQNLEQVADTWYNFQIQFAFAYYDQPHFAAAIGDSGAQELITIHSQDLNRTLIVTVKEGSLVPKDPLTQRNEAMDLWTANGIDPITFAKRLEMPDPYNYAKQLFIWEMIKAGNPQFPPTMLFPDLEMAPPMMPGDQSSQGIPGEQPGTGGPAVNGAPQQGEVQPQQPTGVQEPVGQQSQQLLQQVPIPQH